MSFVAFQVLQAALQYPVPASNVSTDKARLRTYDEDELMKPSQ